MPSGEGKGMLEKEILGTEQFAKIIMILPRPSHGIVKQGVVSGPGGNDSAYRGNPMSVEDGFESAERIQHRGQCGGYAYIVVSNQYGGAAGIGSAKCAQASQSSRGQFDTLIKMPVFFVAITFQAELFV